MTKQEISEYIRIQYPKENEGCDWKDKNRQQSQLDTSVECCEVSARFQQDFLVNSARFQQVYIVKD